MVTSLMNWTSSPSSLSSVSNEMKSSACSGTGVDMAFLGVTRALRMSCTMSRFFP